MAVRHYLLHPRYWRYNDELCETLTLRNSNEFFLKNQLLHKHNFEKKGIVVIFFNRVNDKKIKYQICSAFENVGQ